MDTLYNLRNWCAYSNINSKTVVILNTGAKGIKLKKSYIY